MKKTIKKFLPKNFWVLAKRINSTIRGLKWAFLIKIQPIRHKRALLKIRKKSNTGKKIKIAYFATYSSVWKYDEIYKLFSKDARFEQIVLICPILSSDKHIMMLELEKTSKFFKDNGYNYIITYNNSKKQYLDVKKEIDPDLIFYTMPYSGLVPNKYYISSFRNKLSCYARYFFQSVSSDERFRNDEFHNCLWRFFNETEIHYRMGKSFYLVKGENIVVSGYPGTDKFLHGRSGNEGIWKNKNNELKRIIWAPHHSFDSKQDSSIVSQSTFLKYYRAMLEIAEKYEDKLQIAFKPHPLLRTKLYDYPGWGKNKTDEYYRKWDKLINCQLETDGYIDLFNTSDAMIFDCNSFVTEYLYCGKPALFLLNNESVKEEFNEFGKMSLEQHYHGRSLEDIIDFIESIVIKGEDYKENNRNSFYFNWLIPPRKKTASQNIVDEVTNAIFSEA